MEVVTLGYVMSDSSLVIEAIVSTTFVTNTSVEAPEIVLDVGYDVNNDTSWETNININETEIIYTDIKPGEVLELEAG